MRIVFMGTPRFACASLEALRRAGHDIAVVVTKPDRPRGRSGRPVPSEVKRLAETMTLPILQPEKVNAPEVLDRVREARPDLIVTAAFGQKLGKELLGIPRLGCFNVHASLLPKYRGAAPINWAILRGEAETGVTIFRMQEQMDAGEIVSQSATPISADETAGELTERLAALAADLLVRTVADIAEGKAAYRTQDPSAATRAPMLKKEDGDVDWSRPATELHNLVRGMTPWPGAFTHHMRTEGAPVRLTLLAVRPEPGFQCGPAAPGTVVSVQKDAIAVATGGGALHVLRLKPAGGRDLPAADYVRGHATRPGDRFARFQTPSG